LHFKEAPTAPTITDVMGDAGDFFVGLFGIISDILLPTAGLGPVQVVIWSALVFTFLPSVISFIKSWK
jgi:hypothetical protein